jgi:hypothetical protein
VGRLLGALGGSSSSLLNVKSMTCDIDRLEPPDGATTECSLDGSAGVCETESTSPLTAENRGPCLISTNSSSSPLCACSPLRFGEV